MRLFWGIQYTVHVDCLIAVTVVCTVCVRLHYYSCEVKFVRECGCEVVGSCKVQHVVSFRFLLPRNLTKSYVYVCVCVCVSRKWSGIVVLMDLININFCQDIKGNVPYKLVQQKYSPLKFNCLTIPVTNYPVAITNVNSDKTAVLCFTFCQITSIITRHEFTLTMFMFINPANTITYCECQFMV